MNLPWLASHLRKCADRIDRPAVPDDSVPAVLSGGCYFGVSLPDDQAERLLGTPRFANGGIVDRGRRDDR